ncbi:hypothetical protein [Streptomyces spinosirectus]
MIRSGVAARGGHAGEGRRRHVTGDTARQLADRGATVPPHGRTAAPPKRPAPAPAA